MTRALLPHVHIPHAHSEALAVQVRHSTNLPHASLTFCPLVNTSCTNLLGIFLPEVSDVHVIFIHWWQIQDRECERKVQVYKPKQLCAARPSKGLEMRQKLNCVTSRGAQECRSSGRTELGPGPASLVCPRYAVATWTRAERTMEHIPSCSNPGRPSPHETSG